MNSIYNFVVRQFAGKASAAIASIILAGVLQGMAWLARQYPGVAGTIDAQAVANTATAVVLAVLNILANKYHLDKATVGTFGSDLQKDTQIPVKRATPLR